MTQSLAATDVPKLVRGVRLRHDEARGQWVLLAPEKVLNPDPVAVEILKKVDGMRTIDSIVDELVTAFSVDRERVAADVDAFLAGLKEKGIIETMPSPIGDAAS
ncbi:pyrroloquinoline quinone biosynthesis peptide chaperone PqqD [Ancylobacter pratisalsi]|uniref:Pyrroloquinoline quinone biosynthesis peptide chaperone PqqD n=1 Tax=Ancylobacter pratisalsi TaxID=1745854 RepID=A0A6P1YUQ2_9HYPH|nr:pyrroloquinoline quinone biosynthesis peptide chaperone PqqD [Ancylobacter pratisalsi]